VSSEFIIELETAIGPTIVTETRFQQTSATGDADDSGQSTRGVSKQHVDQGYMDTPVTGLRTPSDGGGDRSIPETEQQPKTPPSCNLDAEHDDAPLRFRNLHDILGPRTPPGRAAREVPDHLYMAEGE
jgi:hypothetical protein